jgi:alkylation response protein AidB-like acyl-CoA dehydrogenase
MPSDLITAPDDLALAQLCQQLADRADALDAGGHWPAEQIALLARGGVFAWFVPAEYGGQGWSEAELSAACLTTTFILTQWTASCRRIVASANDGLRARLLPELAAGRQFTTVGISHLTTSRRHLGRPILTAEETADGYKLDGYSAWVTAAGHADVIVTGGTLADGRQVLLAVPTDLPGIEAAAPARLTALSASHTGELRLRGVHVPRQQLVAGPVENVLAAAAGPATGGLQTSTLAIGLSSAAIRFLRQEGQARPELHDATAALEGECGELTATLLRLAAGEEAAGATEFRAKANSLALRATQSALAAAKGAGFAVGHPAGRWCREALFFLVWSCPQPVMAANLCELAGLAG